MVTRPRTLAIPMKRTSVLAGTASRRILLHAEDQGQRPPPESAGMIREVTGTGNALECKKGKP
jgi:hypothetical protein